MRSTKILFFATAILSSSAIFAEDNNITQAICKSHEDSNESRVRHRNCDRLIVKLSCSHPESGGFEGLFKEDKRKIQRCFKRYGSDAKDTKMAQSFYPNVNLTIKSQIEGKKETSDGITRQTFSASDLEMHAKLPATLLIATKVITPLTKDMVKRYDLVTRLGLTKLRGENQNEEDFSDALRMRKTSREEDLISTIRAKHEYELAYFQDYKEAKDFELPGLFNFSSFAEMYYTGETLSDSNEICSILGFEKAESSIISRNIIPASIEDGRYMKYIDDQDMHKDEDGIEEIGETLSLKKDSDEEYEVGYRYYESLTCIKLANTYTDKQEDLFDQIVDEKVKIADASLLPELQYGFDKHNWKMPKKKKKVVKTRRSQDAPIKKAQTTTSTNNSGGWDAYPQ